MQKTAIAFSALLALILFAGCGLTFQARTLKDKEMDQPRKDEEAFVFGYVDMEEAKTGLDWAFMTQVEPRVFDPNRYFRAHEDIFYLENMSKGLFRWEYFGGNGVGHVTGTYFGTYAVDYFLKKFKEEITIRVPKAGVFFLGAYKYVHVDGGFGKKDSFSLKPVSKPTERELLEKILAFAEDTKWEATLRKHLRRLKAR